MEKRRPRSTELVYLEKYGLKDIDHSDAVYMTFEPDEMLACEGVPIDYLYFIVSGKAKVCISVSSGRQLLLCYFVSTGIVGEAELMLDRCEAHSTVQAVTAVECIGLPIFVYASTLRNSIGFMNYAARELSRKLARCSMNGAITILQPLEARLCAYILQTADGGAFAQKYTEVAELVGTSYRHLMRCFVKLCDEGILVKTSIGYKIADYQALRNKAGDLYITESDIT